MHNTFDKFFVIVKWILSFLFIIALYFLQKSWLGETLKQRGLIVPLEMSWIWEDLPGMQSGGSMILETFGLETQV